MSIHQPIAPADHRRDRILRLPEVRDRTGLARTTIYRRIAEGTFPSTVQLGAHSVGWYESDIDAWIAAPMGWPRAA